MRSTIMKTIWVLTSAAVTVLGLLTSQAAAQNFAPQNRPAAFGPNPQGPRPDNREDRQHFGSTLSLPLAAARHFRRGTAWPAGKGLRKPNAAGSPGRVLLPARP
jgi:hypothetical protein